MANLLRRSQQAECLVGARAIYQAATRREAVQRYWAWARRWRAEALAVDCPVVASLLEVLDLIEASA